MGPGCDDAQAARACGDCCVLLLVPSLGACPGHRGSCYPACLGAWCGVPGKVSSGPAPSAAYLGGQWHPIGPSGCQDEQKPGETHHPIRVHPKGLQGLKEELGWQQSHWKPCGTEAWPGSQHGAGRGTRDKLCTQVTPHRYQGGHLGAPLGVLWLTSPPDHLSSLLDLFGGWQRVCRSQRPVMGFKSWVLAGTLTD